MHLYTFIMEFAGGTYISQVNASSPKSACVRWAQELNVREIEGLGGKSQEMLVVEMKDVDPIPLNGVSNVWCVRAYIRGKFPLINFVQTDV